MNIVIPAAGKGSRFKSYNVPKTMIDVNGEPMLLKSAKSLGFEGTYIFIIQDNEHTDNLASKLFSAFPGCKIAAIDWETDGAAETALIAKDVINTDGELIIANCDQIMDWDPKEMLKKVRRFDAGLAVIRSDDPKHSYARLNGYANVEEVAEKEVISDLALTGIHYWKKGSYFVESAEEMMKNDKRSKGEFYIGPTYTVLAQQGKKTGVHVLHRKEIHFVGTPEDLQEYLRHAPK